MLVDWSRGDKASLDCLTLLLYDELRRLAAAHLRKSGNEWETVQPTSLVHEAYLKLAGQKELAFQNRAQFFGLAAQVMRNILVDHARGRAAAKRGGGGVAITLVDNLAAVPESAPDILLLHDALEELAKMDERKARIVEMRYFAGMTTEEISRALGISVATIGRDLRMAHAWLHSRMKSAD